MRQTIGDSVSVVGLLRPPEGDVITRPAVAPGSLSFYID